MQRLLKRREKAIKKLLELAPKVLIGSTSESYRTCGTPNCRCHTSGPKHGPHLYVSYRGEHGRTTGYYVPKTLHQTVGEGLAAWKKFQMMAKQLAQINKEILDAQRASMAKSKKGK